MLLSYILVADAASDQSCQVCEEMSDIICIFSQYHMYHIPQLIIITMTGVAAPAQLSSACVKSVSDDLISELTYHHSPHTCHTSILTLSSALVY